jgi:hypothetical protein
MPFNEQIKRKLAKTASLLRRITHKSREPWPPVKDEPAPSTTARQFAAGAAAKAASADDTAAKTSEDPLLAAKERPDPQTGHLHNETVTMRIVTEVVSKPSSRISLEFDPVFLRQLGTIVFSISLFYCALLTMPFVYNFSGGTGLDFSWVFAINHLGNAGFRFGTDVMFTYGPLGFISVPLNIQGNLATANLVRGAVWLILLIQLVRLYRLPVNGFSKALLLMVGLCMSRMLILGAFDYFIVITVLVVALDLIEEPRQWPGYVCLISLCTLALFVKFTSYVLSLTVVGVYLAVRLDWPPRPAAWREYAVGAAAIAAGPVAFLIYNPSLSGLRKYVVGSLELSSGFSEAMSLPTSPQDAFYAIVLAGLFLVGLGYAVAKRVLVWTAVPVLGMLYWINFKHGFVRSDGHVISAYGFEAFLAVYLICLLRPWSAVIIQYLVVLPVVLLTTLAGINSYMPVWNNEFLSSANNRQLGLDLLDWFKTEARLEEANRKADEFKQLPTSFISLLEDSTVVVFPWELTYAQSGHFRLWPLYTLQTYVAYSAYLDRITASELRAASKHVDYVLFEWKGSDGRHPLLNVPATWSEIFDEYEPVSSQAGKMVLRHRKTTLQHRLGPSYGSVSLPIGQWVDLPRKSAVLWAKVYIPYSREGAWRKTLYKADAMYLSFGRVSGGVERFRVVPGVLASAFPLNTLPLDFEALRILWGTNRVDDPIARLRLESDSPNDYGRPGLELFEEQGSSVKAANDRSESFQAKFGVESPEKITNGLRLIVDQINKGPVSALPDEAHPFLLGRKRGLELIGWSLTPDNASILDGVYGVVNGRSWVRAAAVSRPDVAKALNNPALELSGYKFSISTAELPIGVQRLEVVGVTNKTHKLYRSVPLYFEVR